MKNALLALSIALAVSLPTLGANPSQHTLQLLKPTTPLIADTFSKNPVPQRRLTRGEWILKNNTATCTQDDELFKELKNHGPAIWYDIKYHNAIIQFQFKASKTTEKVVFTVNTADGHVFRFVTGEVTDIRAWEPDHTGKRLVTDGPGLTREQWVPVTVELAGNKAVVKIGDYTQVVEESSFDVDKVIVGFSHHFGTLSLRGFKVFKGVAKN